MGRGRRQSTGEAGARFLARRLFDGKEGAEQHLLAVEVELLRGGKIAGDLRSQAGPAGRATGAAARAWIAAFSPATISCGGTRPGPGAPAATPASRATSAAAALRSPIGVFRIGAGEPVGERMQPADIDPRHLRQQFEHGAIEGEPAAIGKTERPADAAAASAASPSASAASSSGRYRPISPAATGCGKGGEPQPPAARADRRQQPAGVVADQQQQRPAAAALRGS